MVPVVAALLLRKSRSGYSFLFVCACEHFLWVCMSLRMCFEEEGEIIRMERVRDHITVSQEKKPYESPM